MTPVPAFSSAADAMATVRAGLGFLAGADATQMAVQTQAECLQMLEQVTAMGTAARTAILAAFTSAQGYSADADYSPRAWLVNRTRVTKAAAVGYTAWVRRAAGAPPGRRGAGRRGDVGVLRPGDLRVDRQAPGRTAGRMRTRSWSRPRGRGWTCGT